MLEPLALYIHWPYCLSKCPYCDFNSHVTKTVEHPQWAQAYIHEINYYKNLLGARNITSIFFGGGTPSLMAPETIQSVLAHIDKAWGLSDACEITLEANPTSVEASKFQDFKRAGINRVSVGVQSLNAQDLKFLGREHSPEEALKAVEVAAQTFDRFSFDMIYARPKQTVDSWSQELCQALSHMGNHASLYQLTIEPNTPFFTRYNRGEFHIPDDKISADLYEVTEDIMRDAGFNSYELSNYARGEEASRHNMTYWRYGDYLGIGPGAHGRYTNAGQKFATRAHRAPDIWLKQVLDTQKPALQDCFSLTEEEQFQEKVLMGLRLSEGMPSSLFEAKKVDALLNNGDLEMRDNATLYATRQGRLRLNSVIGYLLT